MGWTILVLITKGNTYTQGIGLLETLWKVMEDIINTRLQSSIHFHNFLYGFCARRGTGTVTKELELAQEISSFDQDLLILVFLDLRKAYDRL